MQYAGLIWSTSGIIPVDLALSSILAETFVAIFFPVEYVTVLIHFLTWLKCCVLQYLFFQRCEFNDCLNGNSYLFGWVHAKLIFPLSTFFAANLKEMKKAQICLYFDFVTQAVFFSMRSPLESWNRFTPFWLIWDRRFIMGLDSDLFVIFSSN